jgi:hypothetical protein
MQTRHFGPAAVVLAASHERTRSTSSTSGNPLQLVPVNLAPFNGVFEGFELHGMILHGRKLAEHRVAKARPMTV